MILSVGKISSISYLSIFPQGLRVVAVPMTENPTTLRSFGERWDDGRIR
jgi:hypothetical protein